MVGPYTQNIRNVLQGPSFGFSDEAMALGRHLSGGEPYGQALASEQRLLGEYAQQHPVRAPVEQFAGAAFGPGLSSIKGFRNLPWDWKAKALTAGAVEGGIAGAGTAQGDLLDRLKGAGIGAAAGGPLGLAGAGAVVAGGNLLGAAERGIPPLFKGPRECAIGRMAGYAQETGIDPNVARADALAAEAPQFRTAAWGEAEKALEDAAKTLEKGNLNSARNKAERAQALYRQVELESIKANFLDETRALLATNEKELKKTTPETFIRATKLVDDAEKNLAENRYDTDQARQLALEAKYEAAHASYLSGQINRMREEDITVERLFLDSELPLQRISDELDLNPRFEEGPKIPTDAIIQKIKDMKREAASLHQDINDQREQITAMSRTITFSW